MIYHLTQQQFNKIWNVGYQPPNCHWASGRINWWNSYIEPKWNITYDELETGSVTEFDDPGYWGMLEGEEKHINWFLLQL
jgi:hypothetical protein